MNVPGSLWVTTVHVGIRGTSIAGEVVPPDRFVLLVGVEGLWARVLLGDGRPAWIDCAWWRGESAAFRRVDHTYDALGTVPQGERS